MFYTILPIASIKQFSLYVLLLKIVISHFIWSNSFNGSNGSKLFIISYSRLRFDHNYCL